MCRAIALIVVSQLTITVNVQNSNNTIIIISLKCTVAYNTIIIIWIERTIGPHEPNNDNNTNDGRRTHNIR